MKPVQGDLRPAPSARRARSSPLSLGGCPKIDWDWALDLRVLLEGAAYAAPGLIPDSGQSLLEGRGDADTEGSVARIDEAGVQLPTRTVVAEVTVLGAPHSRV